MLQAASEGVSLPGVVAATGMPKSSAFRYLSTLEARRYVERDPEGGAYHLGGAFLPLRARQLDVLAEQARPHLAQLSAGLGETVSLGVLDASRVTYLDVQESPSALRVAPRHGDRDHIHSSATGKAVAAHLPDDHVWAILAIEGMPALTDRTVTDPDTYLSQLAEVRTTGHALDDGESEPGGRCVAVPLPGLPWPAAIAVSAPATRLPLSHTDDVAAALGDLASKLIEDFAGHRLA